MKEQKKFLGILGGMGPEATQILYHRIIDKTPAKNDQEHIPTLILSDTFIPDRTASILSHNTEDIFNKLLSDCLFLEKSGCSCIAISCNTAHYFADDLQEKLSIPILHMPRLTIKRIKENPKNKKIAIIATDGTIKTGVYRKAIETYGLIAFEPEEDIQKEVMHLIYDEIKKGEKGNPDTFAKIDKAIKDAGCDKAILGCTELSVYKEYHELSNMYIDSTDVLADECVKFFLHNYTE